MPISEEVIRVSVQGAREAEASIDKVAGATKRSEEQVAKHAGVMPVLAKNTDHATRAFGRFRAAVSYAGGLFGLAAVGYGLKDVVTSGIKAEEQRALLTNAIADTGQHGTRAHR